VYVGGLGVACQGLTRALCEDDVAVTFVLPRRLELSAHNMNFLFADNSQISVREVNSLLTPYITSSSYQYLRRRIQDPNYSHTLFEEVDRYTEKAALIADEAPHDLIHAHDWLTFGAGMEASRISKKPFIAHVHSTEFDRTGGHGLNQHVYDLERHGLEKADAVIAVSGFTKDILMREYGIQENKIHVVHNAIDPNLYSFDVDSSEEFVQLKYKGLKIVLFVGRITLQKGPEYFVQVAKRVLPYEPKTLFVMAGAGDMEHNVMEMAAQYRISDKLLFTGFLRDRELSKMYKASDLFMMTSVSEPFGITALEAVIHGTPLLVSKQTGVSEVIGNALKTDFWDIDEMANQVIASLRYPSLRQTLSQNAAAEVKHLNWKKVADKCVSIYRKVLMN
jgi:glycosyltransferase involved in cell wall biosynthesis